jgi:hypothetical protein
MLRTSLNHTIALYRKRDREIAETNLNEIVGFEAAVLIGFRYNSIERRPFLTAIVEPIFQPDWRGWLPPQTRIGYCGIAARPKVVRPGYETT